MARPRGPEQRTPVKMRVNIGLMDRLQQLATENRCSVPKLLSRIMEDALTDLPADYELHEMTETYTLTKNPASQCKPDERIFAAGRTGIYVKACAPNERIHWRYSYQLSLGLSGCTRLAVKLTNKSDHNWGSAGTVWLPQFFVIQHFFKHCSAHGKKLCSIPCGNSLSFCGFLIFTASTSADAYEIYRDHLIWVTAQSYLKLLP